MNSKALKHQIPRILAKTLDGSLQWNASEADPGILYCSLRKILLTLSRQIEDDKAVVYELSLHNTSGDIVDFESERQENNIIDDGPLAQLYERAQRSSLRIDETLKELEQYLEKLDEDIPF